ISSNEVKTIGQDIQKAFLDLQKKLDEVIIQKGRYPFADSLIPYSDEIKSMAEKPYVWYVISMTSRQPQWLEAKEQLIDPIQRFMSGAQKTIFDRAREFITNNQANSAYLDAESLILVQTIMNDAECFKDGKIQQLKSKTDQLQDQLDRILVKEKEAALTIVRHKLDQLEGIEGFTSIDEYGQIELRRPSEQVLQQIEYQTVIAVIRDLAIRAEGELWTKALNRISDLHAVDTPGIPPKPPKEYISIRAVRVPSGGNTLEKEEDVDHYICSLKCEILRLLSEGKGISL
ncbi:MAG: hypothetical protein ACYC5K_14355, partial [Saccharofermentanales bacterium]